jgi:hypothetical protein
MYSVKHAFLAVALSRHIPYGTVIHAISLPAHKSLILTCRDAYATGCDTLVSSSKGKQ